MELVLAVGEAERLRTEILVVGVFSDLPLVGTARALDQSTKGTLRRIVERGELRGGVGATLLLHHLPGAAAARVLVVNLGRSLEFSEHSFRQALSGTASALSECLGDEAVVTLAEFEVPGRPLDWRVRQAARILAEGAYRFDLTAAAGRVGDRPASGVRSVLLIVPQALTSEMNTALRQGLAVAEGIALAKDVGNLPGNICTPVYLARKAEEMGEEYGFEVEVLKREEIADLGMGAFLAVSGASTNGSRLIVARYTFRRSRQRPIVLVGQGVSFRAGGLLPRAGGEPEEASFDVSGAGSVLGALRTAAKLRLKLNLVGIIAVAETAAWNGASRPGDIVTSMSGRTIEIRGTGGEARLLLCDALTYAERFDPACVIDVGTFTGSCVIALGSHASGLFVNDDELAAEIVQCGGESGDRVWRLPLWEDYLPPPGSRAADVANPTGRVAEAIAAACFLAQFTKAFPWAHLDTAGTASITGQSRVSTGRPVPLLTEFLLRRAAQAA
jgi:leucyl aminopeptidase